MCIIKHNCVKSDPIHEAHFTITSRALKNISSIKRLQEMKIYSERLVYHMYEHILKVGIYKKKKRNTTLKSIIIRSLNAFHICIRICKFRNTLIIC